MPWRPRCGASPRRCRRSPPAAQGLGLPRGTEAQFVRPDLHAEVEFLEVTDASRLRQPVWRGLRG
ncbi:hypothetical protein ACIGXI_34635 [Kitasatospora aureofaciens]|uniref:ATP dependent DNA ligase n=1 Tax=Kitasatospora aureofaciens TaxID=1894 RepID=UPI0037C54F30